MSDIVQDLRNLADRIDRGWPLLAHDVQTREYEDGEVEINVAITDQNEQPSTLLWSADPEEDWAVDHAISIVVARNEGPAALRAAADEIERLRGVPQSPEEREGG